MAAKWLTTLNNFFARGSSGGNTASKNVTGTTVTAAQKNNVSTTTKTNPTGYSSYVAGTTRGTSANSTGTKAGTDYSGLSGSKNYASSTSYYNKLANDLVNSSSANLSNTTPSVATMNGLKAAEAGTTLNTVAPKEAYSTKINTPSSYAAIKEITDAARSANNITDVNGNINPDIKNYVSNYLKKATGIGGYSTYYGDDWMGDPETYNAYKNDIISKYGQDVWDAYSTSAAKDYTETYGISPGQSRTEAYKELNGTTTLQSALDSLNQSKSDLANAAAQLVTDTEAAKKSDISDALSAIAAMNPKTLAWAYRKNQGSLDSSANQGVKNLSTIQSVANANQEAIDEKANAINEKYIDLLATARQKKYDAEEAGLNADTNVANALANTEAYTNYGATAAETNAKVSYETALINAQSNNATLNQKEGYTQLTALQNSSTRPDKYALYGSLMLMGMDSDEALNQAALIQKQWDTEHPKKTNSTIIEKAAEQGSQVAT